MSNQGVIRREEIWSALMDIGQTISASRLHDGRIDEKQALGIISAYRVRRLGESGLEITPRRGINDANRALAYLHRFGYFDV